MLWFESIWSFFQDFKQVVLDILEYQVHNSLFAKSLLELDNVGMLKHFQDFDLSHGSLLDDLVLFGFFELFDGDDFFVFIALALEDYSICALADEPHNIVLLHINFITILIQLY